MNTNKTSPKYKPVVWAAYLRVSSDKQDATAERQREAIARWAEDRKIEITYWFTDVGSRDKAEVRPEFQRMLKLVKEGAINAVVVQALDRFGIKDGDEWGYYRHLFRREWGCAIWDACENRELTANDRATRFISTFKADASEEEIGKIADRIVGGIVKAARHGTKLGSNPPFGYDTGIFSGGKLLFRVHYLGKKRLQQVFPNGQVIERDKAPARNKEETVKLVPSIDTQRQEIVKSIFKWYTTEVISMRQIALRLLGRGLTIYGHPWMGHHVAQILTNPAYLGWVVANRRSRARFKECLAGQVRDTSDSIRLSPRTKKTPRRTREQTDWIIAKDAHPALIDLNTFDKAQERYKNSKRHIRLRFPNYWLRGTLVCGHCRKALICKQERNGLKPGPYKKGPKKGMARQGKGRVPAYGCQTYIYAKQHGLTCTCKRNTITHADAERLVLDYLKTVRAEIDLSTDQNDYDALLALFSQFSAKTDECWAVAREGLADYCTRIKEAFGLTADGKKDEDHLLALLRELLERYNAKAQARGEEPFDMSDMYDLVAVIEEEKIVLARSRLEAAKMKLKPIALSWAQATGYERDVLREEVERLNAEIARWQAETVPLLDRLDAIEDECNAIRDRIDTAILTLEESADLRKAEIVREVLSEVVLYWKPNPKRPREQVLDRERTAFRVAIAEGALMRPR
jgi:DNA invertase Pin-like site-specific DNA recombinase